MKAKPRKWGDCRVATLPPMRFVDSRLRGNDRADRSVMAVVIDKGLSFGYEERADCGAFTR